MNRKQIILHLWDAAYDVEDWHPPLRNALRDVNCEQALWRADSEGHNIWELVNHIICYKDRFICRLEGRDFESITDNEKTFQRGLGSTEAEWQARLSHLSKLQSAIRNKLGALTDPDLDKVLPEAPIGNQVLSLTSHDSYHTGQIMFLRKLQQSWPQTRDV